MKSRFVSAPDRAVTFVAIGLLAGVLAIAFEIAARF